MAATYTITKREMVGSRKCNSVTIAIESATTLPLALTPALVGLADHIDDVDVLGCHKSDLTQGYALEWDGVGKQLNALGSNGATPDLVQDTSANAAQIARIRAYGI